MQQTEICGDPSGRVPCPYVNRSVSNMTLEILLSCMHQQGDELVQSSRITGDVVVVNQCDREEYAEYTTDNGRARIFSTTHRGLTKSRNMAIDKSQADICLICDDDEQFVPDYEKAIVRAYEALPKADIIIFKMVGRESGFRNRVFRLRFPMTLKVSSWQMSFRRERIVAAGVRFDELLGAGSGNGAEEELKFLLDCQRAGLVMYYVPVEIASVAQTSSTWFFGYTQSYFENRGATTRYAMGVPLACLYAVHFVITKHKLYRAEISLWKALCAVFRGIGRNKIGNQAKALKAVCDSCK